MPKKRMRNHHPYRSGITILNGDQNSDLPTMLGIKPHRRVELEEAIKKEIELRESNFLSVVSVIIDISVNANELSFCMYYFGSTSFKRGRVSLETLAES